MASKKITAMPNLAGGQVSTDLATLVDLSAAVANQNAKSTLNDLFSIITKNITDGALRFQGTFNPAVSAANQGALFYNDVTDTFQGSRNTSAYENLLFGNSTAFNVAYFGSLVDQVLGNAGFTYNPAGTAVPSVGNVEARITQQNHSRTALYVSGPGTGLDVVSLAQFDNSTLNCSFQITPAALQNQLILQNFSDEGVSKFCSMLMEDTVSTNICQLQFKDNFGSNLNIWVTGTATDGTGTLDTPRSSVIFAACTVNGLFIIADGAVNENIYLCSGTDYTDINLTMDGIGNIVMGNAALATNAQFGFFWLNASAGIPTGTPSTVSATSFWNHTGRVPLTFDSTGGKFYAYFNGVWNGLGRQVVSAVAATPRAVLATESDNIFSNEGAAAQIEFTLPGAAASLAYTWIVQDADGIKITAAAGDTIRFGGTVTAAAGNITSTTIGSTITLVAINATEWVATSIVGTWA